MSSTTVPNGVIAKLLLATAAMIFLPITSYFVTVDKVWNGSQTLAAATAAVVANIILAAFVINALLEPTPSDKVLEKKSQ